MQDLLGLDNAARMNQPSTVKTNWRWRMEKGMLTKAVQKQLLALTRTYGRFNWKTVEKIEEKQA